jgi:hypothetical protein
MSDPIMPKVDPTTDTLDKRLWLGSRIAQAEERLDTFGARLDALASRIGPAPAIPEAGSSKENQLENRFTDVICSVRYRHELKPIDNASIVASLMEAVRICGGLAKTNFPTQPLKPKQ